MIRRLLAAPLRALGPLREHEQLLMISISTVLVMAGQGVITPILPLFAAELGVGYAAVGLTLTMFALARLILNVPLGILSDRYGRRVLLVSGPLVTSVGMIGSGMAGDIVSLLAWRFVAGAGSAMYMTGAAIYLTDISTPDNRARFIGTNQGALLLGVSLGPGIGGLVAEGFGLRAPFYVVGVAALVATVYAYLRIPETRGLARHEPAPLADGQEPPKGAAWARMVRSRDFVAVSLVTMAIFLTRTAGRQTLVPLLAAMRLGMSPGVLGGVFMVTSLIQMVLLAPAAWLADRFGRKWSIVPSGVLTAVGLLLTAFAFDYPTFFAAMFVLAIGTSMAGPAPAAYAADIAPPEIRGLAMGLYRTSGDIGFVIGPPLLGALADATNFGWGLGANAAFMLATTLFFALGARETSGRPPSLRSRTPRASEAPPVPGGG